MISRHFAAAALICAATAAMAHQGVKNPAVKARMDAMGEIAARMKVLGTMAQGKVAFDAAEARSAAAGIAAHAARTAELFEARETDPKSEAHEAIWEEFDTFTDIADDLVEVAENLSVSIDGPNDVARAVREIGATCKACHQKYRE